MTTQDCWAGSGPLTASLGWAGSGPLNWILAKLERLQGWAAVQMYRRSRMRWGASGGTKVLVELATCARAEGVIHEYGARQQASGHARVSKEGSTQQTQEQREVDAVHMDATGSATAYLDAPTARM